MMAGPPATPYGRTSLLDSQAAKQDAVRQLYTAGAISLYYLALRLHFGPGSVRSLFPIIRDWVHDGWIAMLIACLSGHPLHFRAAGAISPTRIAAVGASQATRSPATEHRGARPAALVIPGCASRHSGRCRCCSGSGPVDRTHGAAADFLRHGHPRIVSTPPANRLARLMRMLRMHKEYRVGASSRWSGP